MISTYKDICYSEDMDTKIGWNSVDFAGKKYFVSISGGFLIKATASTAIVWVSETSKAMASDNQTVAKATVNYIPKRAKNLYNVTITGGTITQADEGKYYNLSDSETVDWTTEATVKSVVNTSDAGSATDPVLTMQLELVKFVSATNSIFRIVL